LEAMAREGASRKNTEQVLARAFPSVAAEWHPTKNRPLTPRQALVTSTYRAFWRCRRDPSHVWITSVVQRLERGFGCPFCAGKRWARTSSLRERFPLLAAEWHPTKNDVLTPADVNPRSERRVWWQCAKRKTHVWQETVVARVSTGSRCPMCFGTGPERLRSLATVFPKIAAEWHPTKNGALRPEDVRPRTDKHVWWRCSRNPTHVWRVSIDNRTGPRKSGCPYCSGRVADAKSSLRALYPAIAAEWHPTKNGALDPGEITTKSHRKVFWQCLRNPSHEWQMTILSRTFSGQGCPLCASLRGRNPRLAAEWHPSKNGRLTPDDVRPSSHQRVWWKCRSNEDHVWRTSVSARKGGEVGCPYCAGKLVDKHNSLLALYPRVAADWHPAKNGALKPSDVRPGSGKHVFWRCQYNPHHVWRAVIQSRTTKGAGCPQCWLDSRRRPHPRRRTRPSMPLIV